MPTEEPKCECQHDPGSCPLHNPDAYLTKEQLENLEKKFRKQFNSSREDNWQHRSANMRCRTCMYFLLKKIEIKRFDEHTIGRCRRNAPTMKGWPVVFLTDWCGDHKLDEAKI